MEAEKQNSINNESSHGVDINFLIPNESASMTPNSKDRGLFFEGDSKFMSPNASKLCDRSVLIHQIYMQNNLDQQEDEIAKYETIIEDLLSQVHTTNEENSGLKNKLLGFAVLIDKFVSKSVLV